MIPDCFYFILISCSADAAERQTLVEVHRAHKRAMSPPCRFVAPVRKAASVWSARRVFENWNRHSHVAADSWEITGVAHAHWLLGRNSQAEGS